MSSRKNKQKKKKRKNKLRTVHEKLTQINVISKSSSVSAATHSSIRSTAATSWPSTTRAVVWITGRVTPVHRRSRAPVLPAHALTTARWIWVTPTAGVTVTTAIAIPGTATIVIITTASTAPTIGWWRAPWRRGAAWVTCRVNGSGNWKGSIYTNSCTIKCSLFFFLVCFANRIYSVRNSFNGWIHSMPNHMLN